ncbi:chemotaxis protein CheW [Spongisporangium articulatum]|uniref:Chemotaxis protein CheW n=1 Tax=Spongisporangium articulatum TaxID=3362603 RepID=A0ABW8AM63_9ACTN
MTTTATGQAPGTVPAPAEPRDDVVTDERRYLTFTLQDELYAIDILQVTEIIEFRSLTVVPMMPPFIRGVLNLRGRVLPVVDLAARFEHGATEVRRRTAVIVVRAGGEGTATQDVGVMVDGVNKVIHLGADDIEPPPAFGAGVRTDFISGMARADAGFLIVLNTAQVLAGAAELADAVRADAVRADAVRADARADGEAGG